MELMENEALEILTKALRSEPYPKFPQVTLGDFAELGSVGVGFQDLGDLSDSLTIHGYSRTPTEVKNWRNEHSETQWGEHAVTVRAWTSSLK